MEHVSEYRSGRYVDSEAPVIVEFAQRIGRDETDEVGRAVRLYYAVRDSIVYTPYFDFRSEDTYRASTCLIRGSGFCVAKAALLAAAARVVGIPAQGRICGCPQPSLHTSAAGADGNRHFLLPLPMPSCCCVASG